MTRDCGEMDLLSKGDRSDKVGAKRSRSQNRNERWLSTGRNDKEATTAQGLRVGRRIVTSTLHVYCVQHITTYI